MYRTVLNDPRWVTTHGLRTAHQDSFSLNLFAPSVRVKTLHVRGIASRPGRGLSTLMLEGEACSVCGQAELFSEIQCADVFPAPAAGRHRAAGLHWAWAATGKEMGSDSNRTTGEHGVCRSASGWTVWGDEGRQAPWTQARRVLGVIFQSCFPRDNRLLFLVGEELLGLLIFLSFPLPQESGPS